MFVSTPSCPVPPVNFTKPLVVCNGSETTPAPVAARNGVLFVKSVTPELFAVPTKRGSDPEIRKVAFAPKG